MKTKILIVDDLIENISALSRLIEADDVEILTAQSPEVALNLILDNDFGLALLDVQMPIMNGFELARLIRGVNRSRHLPIIFVTAQQSESRLIFEGYESGAVDLLFKPLDPHMVRSKVRVFVRLDQQSRQLAAQVETMGRLKEDAEAANVAKSRFLANMSHEIRTPLSAVLGFADVLSQGQLTDEERSQSLSAISRNGQLLLRIIDDILDLSRIEARKLEFERTSFEMEEVLKDLEITLANKALERGIQVTFTKSKAVTGRYISDPLRLKQILLNMVGNAIKFTDKGYVNVSVCSRDIPALNPDSVPTSEVRFLVEDTGIGLTPEEANRLFEPFGQADTSTRRKYGGTGLGLAISKQLAQSLGGDVILLKSEPGQGSTFEVKVRLQREDEVSTAARVELEKEAKSNAKVGAHSNGKSFANAAGTLRNLEGKRILIVDDVADNRTLMERYLRPSGVQVGFASGGQEALDSAKETDWDAILMDIQMPNMDGYEATSRLRQLGYERPIIALTAHAMREELQQCLNAGCNETMTKPVARKDLLNRLNEIFR